MVVVSVIAVLAAVLMPTVSNFTSKSRDARRKSDINTITVALEAFRNDNGRYPTPGESGTNSCGGWRASDTTDFMLGLTNGGYLKRRPGDPINTGNGCSGYCYSYYRYTNPYCGATTPFYVVGARVLEEGADPYRINVTGLTCARDWTTEFDYLFSDHDG